MRWNVEGADARTGKDRLVTIEADDERSAEQIARNKGMLIAAVHPVKVLSPAEKLEHVMAGTLDASTVTTPGMIPSTIPGPREQLAAEWNERVIDHAADQEESHPAPPASPADLTTSTIFSAAQTETITPGVGERIGLDYRGVIPRLLRMRSRHPSEPVPQYVSLHVATILLIVLAVAAYVAGVVDIIETLLDSGYVWRSSRGIFAAVATIYNAMKPVMIGAALHALSAMCAAVRDIAQNSFNR